MMSSSLLRVVTFAPPSAFSGVLRSSVVFQNYIRPTATDATVAVAGEVSIEYMAGLPTVTIPLPSRQERCQFTLKPVTNTVTDFCRFIQEEDRGVDKVSIFTRDGTRISGSTSIEHLMRLGEFNLRINDTVLEAAFPPASATDASDTPAAFHLTSDQSQSIGELKSLICSLHATLNVEEHQLRIENELLGKIEDLKLEIAPLEEKKIELAVEAEKRSTRLMWGGLGLMGIQWGAFARLTWWEYSWDIMEPVTYFATYSTAIIGFMYYLITRQSYEYHEAKNRMFLSGFHKKAQKIGFDVDKYNKLKRSITEVEHDLNRLRDPLYLHLPLHRLQALQLKKIQDKAAAENEDKDSY